MKPVLLTAINIIFSLLMSAQNGNDILKRMHKKYFKAPCKSYSFSQKNTHYKNDTISGNSIWHESIEFPDKFRIDFGTKQTGNFVIFKNDSVFNYKANTLVKTRSDSSTLLLLLGGMYYRNIDDVISRIQNAHYNLKVLSLQIWNKNETYVIGAKAGDLSSNQIWVDKTTLKVMRIIEKMNAQETMDMRFEEHQASCKGLMETKVSFWRNGVLEQIEEYFNIKESSSFPYY